MQYFYLMYLIWFLIFLQFLQQHQHYKSILEVFRLAPNKFNKSLDEVVIFLAQVTLIIVWKTILHNSNKYTFVS